jgi:hypothetical protein
MLIDCAISGVTILVRKEAEKILKCKEGTTENCHIGHCTYTVESADVKVH